jgi:hypothetical protein
VLLAGMELIRNPDPDIKDLSETAVARFREQNLRWELGVGLLIQANWWSLYSYDEGKLLEALQIFRELGVVFEQGLALQLLGRHAFQQRRPPAESRYFQQAKGLDEQLGPAQHPSTGSAWRIYLNKEAEGFSVF